MSRHIYVYASEFPIPKNLDQHLPATAAWEALDVWLMQQTQPPIYETPLAAEGIFYEYWHIPAQYLGLKLVSSIYYYGFQSAQKSELICLELEMKSIRISWETMNLSEEAMAGLLEQYDRLLKGIDVALAASAILLIV